MAAVAGGVTSVLADVSGFLADASEGWDPIGHMIWDDAEGEFNNLSNTLYDFSAEYDPLDPVTRPVAEGISDISASALDELQWVAEAIHDTGTSIDEGMRDIGIDPDTVKMAVASIALTVTGQVWAIPLLNAAMTKAKGGSWEDAALNAAVSYVAGSAGAYVGQYVSGATYAGQAAMEYGISAGGQQAAMIAAQNAGVLGGTTAFTANTLAGLASAGVSDATAQLLRTGTVDLDHTLQVMATSGITSGVSALTSQIPGFSSLPASAQKTINTQLASAAQGKDVNMDALGMSLMSDMAMDAMKTYYKDVFSGVQSAYNTAAEKFNTLSGVAQESKQAATTLYQQVNDTQSQIDANVAKYDALVKVANDTKDRTLIPQIDALKATILSQVDQRDSLIGNYTSAYDQYKADVAPLGGAMQDLLQQRDSVFTYMAKSVDPEFDGQAYLSLNPELAKLTKTTDSYGANMSAAEIFLTQQAQSPTPQITSWREGFLNADASNFDQVETAYQQATGFQLTPDAAKTDFALYTAYQTGMANSTQDLLAQAAEAEAAGDSTKYSELMSKAFAQASSENLGWVQRDQSGNYVWGNQVYDNTGTLVADLTPSDTGTTDVLTPTYAQSLYGQLSPQEIAAAQEAAQQEAVKKSLAEQGYTATTQEEAAQLAQAGDTYKDVTDPLAAYAKEHTVTEKDVTDYLKQFNYQNFFKGLAPYIGQGAQYAQAKMQQDALQKAMQYAMQQGTQFAPGTTSKSTGAAAAGLTGLAGLAALMGSTSGGTAAETPQAQIQTRNITPYGDTAAEAAGKVGITQMLGHEMDITPGAQPPEPQAEQPSATDTNTEDTDVNFNWREGGVIPNVNFGYTDQVQAMASGGIASLAPKSNLGSFSDGGQLLKGPGTGLSDNIPATIDKTQPARLASGEFVVPADVVSALGGGSTEAGAKILYEMLDRIRHEAHGSKRQIKQVSPGKVLPK